MTENKEREKTLHGGDQLVFFNKVFQGSDDLTCKIGNEVVTFAVPCSVDKPGISAKRHTGTAEDTYSARAYDIEGTLFCFYDSLAKDVFDHMRKAYAESHVEEEESREVAGLRRARAFLNAEEED